jgi:DNA-binding response OmpR family regulator
MERIQTPTLRPKIFVLDDSPTGLAFVKMVLEAEGYLVCTFNSPLGISREILRQKPDLVIVDVNMPSITGDKVCRLIRATSSRRSVGILLHSSLPECDLHDLAQACGADNYVPKSRDPRALCMAVCKQLFGHLQPPASRAAHA